MFPDIELADNDAITSMVAEDCVKQDRAVVGHKIGLISKAIQASSKSDEPDVG